ncbi:EpsD family peptidyl-prolyl cis-trans isomerase [uncultured Piscinibacter sp.]|uniref:EpsD family peptidyl-prolyl cis-trans isomerase n=1 Tax=uncultured Piscinibacter sp. TaxID=1131835 RepID=UPI002613239D|nr:EpsD family peptidyl-prolyl cis-trans isomerase [uncultured Piscinibacter sp.]
MCSLLLAACGGGERTSGDSQIAAKVNKGEISVHQVQVVLQRQPRLAASEGGSAAARALEGLIDQELAAQSARGASLDKDPRVVQRLQAAQREILAQAWQESVASRVRDATTDEIDRYYDERTALFSQRRLYLLRETSVEGAAELLAGLPEKIAQTQSAEELTHLLQRSAVRSQVRTLAQAAEDLPLGLLGKLSTLDPGRSIAAVQGGQARIYTVLHAELAPVDRRQAGAAIGAFLANERKAEAVAEAMRQLRAEAKIEYRGNFAKPVDAAASAAAVK